jgi:hypothetical protein
MTSVLGYRGTVVILSGHAQWAGLHELQGLGEGTIQGISICLRQHGTPYSWDKGITQQPQGELDEDNDNEARS